MWSLLSALLAVLLQLPTPLPSVPLPPAPFEKYPGQSVHADPPKDWVCERPALERIGKASKEEQAHWCSCERVWDDELQWMHNDEMCSVHCHEDKCTCPVSGATPRMPGYRAPSTPNPFR
jgi:hypothetical protein